jgi:hypothetical protein
MFYALKEDILPVLEAVEQDYPLKYIRTGSRLQPEFETFFSCAEILNLGKATQDSAINCETFLITEAANRVRIRTNSPPVGPKRFFVDQLLNPDTVTFSSGGRWNEDIVLYGRIATASDSEFSQKLMKRFHSVIKKRFTKIRAFFVGSEAHKLLDQGKRLTLAVQTPCEFDLTTTP